MMRRESSTWQAALVWPFVALVLLGQDLLLRIVGADPSLHETAYRITAWSIGVTRSPFCSCRAGGSAICWASWCAPD